VLGNIALFNSNPISHQPTPFNCNQ